MESKKFNGKSYNKGKDGYWRKGGGFYYLHRDVWEYYNGPISKGYQIHHKDNNKDNNEISNLQCLSSKRHNQEHPIKDKEKNRKHLENIRPLTKEWHRSIEGKEWHKKHWKDSLGKSFKEREYTCFQCGNKFISRAAQGAKFCHPNCKQKDLRRRRKEAKEKEKSLQSKS